MGIEIFASLSMFYPKKITAIRPGDMVLEIGPGSSPHHRSDVFLELDFESSEEMLSQRGGVSQVPDFHNKPIHYYGGKEFPFKDNQFNYVICSHVLEHVADPEIFLKEVFRVGGGRGYLEYPLATYEYLYGFDVHLQFLKFDFAQRVLKYLPKRDTSFADFASVTALLNKTLACGWDDLCAANKQLFFEGVEFDQPFKIKKTTELAILLPSQSLIVPKSLVRQFFTRILNKIGL